MQKYITIRGARVHNLKNIDVNIPKDKLVVITGLSGSGKSSLAFDTIYAEGQRRYVESLSSYARQFLEKMDKPDVESMDGLSPAIAIEQKTTSKNPRSTVGTVTEIYDYLRILFARVGKPFCYECGKPIESQTVSQMVDQIIELPQNARIQILAPIAKERKGEFQKELKSLRKEGFTRIIIDNNTLDLSDEIKLDKNKKHNIDLVVDRLTIKDKIKTRLADSLETALRFGEGTIKIDIGGKETRLLSEKSACIQCGISYPEITPQMFSFNTPIGACQECSGLGTKMYFDEELIIPNRDLSLREGAITPWHSKSTTYQYQMMSNLARHYKFDINMPFRKLSQKIQEIILYGSGDEEINFDLKGATHQHKYTAPFEGVINNLDRRYHQTDSDWIREDLEKYMNIRPCPECIGSRLKKESLHIKIADKNIHEITKLSIEESGKFFSKLKLTKKESTIAKRVIKEINERLKFLHNVGLGYLTLDRTSATLAGGESQRIRLATQIGSALTGVLYVLDEPSIGLHQRDNHRLLETLRTLRDLGNTVLVVEHDPNTMLAADYIIDLGPGAGLHGGHIIAEGTPDQILKNKKSLTGQYLNGSKKIETPKQRRKALPNEKISIKGACENNLKSVDVDFPLGIFNCVTGVSGSGKSTLINDTLYRVLMQRLYRSKRTAGKIEDIRGLEKIQKVVDIDQSPIGRTPRSNPATYTGVFTHIRDLFTQLPESKTRGYKPGRFSFNVKGGRCEACEGDGVIKIEMHFLPDVYVECEVCKGHRFNRETLEIKYRGSSISDVLEMTVNQSLDFFQNIPAIKKKLQTLIDVGLGYIHLGQPATTLSGGEAQRIKLSRELSKHGGGHTLYILDEPTTGLHFADVQKLLDVLNRLVDNKNTVIVIEHNLDVIKSADYVIDLGPEGGDKGGKVVATGTPEEIAGNSKSFTGKYLKNVL